MGSGDGERGWGAGMRSGEKWGVGVGAFRRADADWLRVPSPAILFTGRTGAEDGGLVDLSLEEHLVSILVDTADAGGDATR